MSRLRHQAARAASAGGTFRPEPDPQPVLDEDGLYCGDNGRMYCGRHAGASARFTGCDLSGMPVEQITAEHQREALSEFGEPFGCEECGHEGGAR